MFTDPNVFVTECFFVEVAYRTILPQLHWIVGRDGAEGKTLTILQLSLLLT